MKKKKALKQLYTELSKPNLDSLRVDTFEKQIKLLSGK